jgi:hypothetical protein
MEYLEEKINEFETDNENKNIRDLYRDINEFKKGYQLELSKRLEYWYACRFPTTFWMDGRINCQLLNVHGINDIRNAYSWAISTWT